MGIYIVRFIITGPKLYTQQIYHLVYLTDIQSVLCGTLLCIVEYDNGFMKYHMTAGMLNYNLIVTGKKI